MQILSLLPIVAILLKYIESETNPLIMRDRLAVLILGVIFLAATSLPAIAQSNPEILPTGLDFGYIPAGSSVTQTISVYNISGGASITLNSITPSITQLQVISGTLPITLGPLQRADYVVQFTADEATSYSGHFTFAIAGKPSQAVNTSGNGTSVTAIPSLSAKLLNFPNQALGTTSKPQTLTITNKGTTTFSVTDVVVTYPFAQSGWTESRRLRQESL